MVRVENQDTGKLVDRGLDQTTLASKKRTAETPSPATGLKRGQPKKGRAESYA